MPLKKICPKFYAMLFTIYISLSCNWEFWNQTLQIQSHTGSSFYWTTKVIFSSNRFYPQKISVVQLVNQDLPFEYPCLHKPVTLSPSDGEFPLWPALLQGWSPFRAWHYPTPHSNSATNISLPCTCTTCTTHTLCTTSSSCSPSGDRACSTTQ